MMLGSSNPAGTGGTNLNYVGNRVYLYSGTVEVDNNATTLAQFNVAANQFIEAEIQFAAAEPSNDDILHTIKIDGEVIHSVLLSNVTSNMYAFSTPIALIFAPNAEIEITAQNQTGGTPRDTTVTITGKVFS